MKAARTVVLALLLIGLLGPAAVAEAADPWEGGAPWDLEEATPEQAVALQQAAHRVVGEASGTEIEAVAALYDLQVEMGVDADTAAAIAQMQAESIEAAKNLSENRSRRSRRRGFLRRIPILGPVANGLGRFVGRTARTAIRGALPNIQDVLLALATGGGSGGLRLLLRSRLRAARRNLAEQTLARWLRRGSRSGPSNDASGAIYTWELTTANFSTHSSRTDQEDPGLGFVDWIDYDPRDAEIDVMGCPGFALTVNRLEATLSLNVETMNLNGTFDGTGETRVDHLDPAGPDTSTVATGVFAGDFAATIPEWAAEGDLYFAGESSVVAEATVNAICRHVAADGTMGTRSVSEEKSAKGVGTVVVHLVPNEGQTHFLLSLIINPCREMQTPCPTIWAESQDIEIPPEWLYG